MSTSTKTIHGTRVEDNTFPSVQNSSNAITIPGRFGNESKHLHLDQELLSKHMLLIGGTGSGKTNLINFIVRDIKKKMTNDDVLVIFDTKGDFVKDFYTENDYVVSAKK